MAPGSRLWTRFKGFGWRQWQPLPPTVQHFTRDFSRYLIVSLTWIPVAVFLNDHVFDITTIRGPSMAPFFNERHHETSWPDVCLTWKMFAQDDLQRGMIITFRWVPCC